MGYLLLTTGMRASELLSLKFNQIIYTSSVNYIELKGKRGEWRRIPLSKKAAYLIDNLKNQLKVEKYDTNYICFNLNLIDKPISYESLRLLTIDVSKIISNDYLTPHWFRRSYITKLLSEGTTLYSVMKVVGHKSINTTNNYLQDIDSITGATIPYK